MTDIVSPSPIPVTQWGRDHWSTYAYLAARMLDYGGRVDRVHLRCDPAIHPHQAHRASAGKYPTRLRDGSEIYGHDDWSCIEDMISAGYVVDRGTGLHPLYSFTERGLALWHEFSTHIMHNQGNWSSTFTPREIQPGEIQ